MPLSEHEQRLLDEMERSLYHNEADDVTTVGARPRANYTAIALGIIAGVIGIALLLVGVISQLPVIGLVGFAIMFTGVMFAIAPPRRLTVRDAASGRGDRARRRPSFMDSLNERWDRRADEDDQ